MLYVNRGKGVYGYMLLQGAYKQIKPATGAVIMANGIFLIGSIEAFPILDIQMGKYLAFILLVLWVMIYKSLTIQFFHRNFLIPFITHPRSEEHTSELQSRGHIVCRLLLEKKN